MTAKEYIRANLNVPNVLTIIRLLLVPVYVAVFAAGYRYWALFVFLLASFTDLLDGRIARRYNLITDFGKLMDPLADKIMVLTAMISMAIGNAQIEPVIPWLAVIILLGKEIYMVQGGAQFRQQAQQFQQPQQPQQPQPFQQPAQFPNVYEPYNPPSMLDNVDYSLESLASEIGKAEQ